MDKQVLVTAVHALVSSRLIAGNSLLYGIAQCQLQHIHITQNTAASPLTDT